jgi:hypothetical protein
MVSAIRTTDQPSNCFLPSRKEIEVDRGIVGATGCGGFLFSMDGLETLGIIRKILNKQGCSSYCSLWNPGGNVFSLTLCVAGETGLSGNNFRPSVKWFIGAVML